MNLNLYASIFTYKIFVKTVSGTIITSDPFTYKIIGGAQLMGL